MRKRIIALFMCVICTAFSACNAKEATENSSQTLTIQPEVVDIPSEDSAKKLTTSDLTYEMFVAMSTDEFKEFCQEYYPTICDDLGMTWDEMTDADWDTAKDLICWELFDKFASLEEVDNDDVSAGNVSKEDASDGDAGEEDLYLTPTEIAALSDGEFLQYLQTILELQTEEPVEIDWSVLTTEDIEMLREIYITDMAFLEEEQ